jgi:hypothetical protein
VRPCVANLIYDDTLLQFSRRRKFSTKIRAKLVKNTIRSAKELEGKEGSKSG